MKHLLLSMAMVSSALVAGSQSIQIQDENGVDISGSTITFQGDNSAFNVITGHLLIKNVSANDLDVKIKRYETSVVSGTQDYFCWFLCYASMDAGVNPLFPTSSQSAYNHSRTVEADSVDDALSVYHRPETNVGVSTYRYVAFDGNNPNDSAFVDVIFDVGYVGVPEIDDIKTVHYPNPASANLTIKLDKYDNNMSIQVVDMLGKKVKSVPVNGNQVNINVTEFKNGVYFYSVVSDKGVLLTRKFLVSR